MTIPMEWVKWTRENLQLGCAPEQLCDTLLKKGFSANEVMPLMGAAFPYGASWDHKGVREGVDYQALAQLQLAPEFTPVANPGNKVQLFAYEDFLSSGECDHLVRVMDTSLKPSTVTVSNGDNYFRTSETCHFSDTSDRLIQDIDLRMARALGLNSSYSEGIQAQKYSQGQEFKPHTDYFQPGTSEFIKFAARMGQRTWTFTVYLKATQEGGGTHFIHLNKTFYPKKGLALAWNNLYPSGQPNPDTKHQGQPVIKGDKYIITKWFRDVGSGLMKS